MNEVKGYRWFVKHFAPLGYAHLYRRIGDFHQAQKALERVVKDGYDTWMNTRPDGLPGFGARLMIGMVNTHRLEEAPPEAIQSSFARSRKLAAVHEAIGVINEFKDEEGIALFLLYVEETPEEHLHEWLGVDEARIEAIRERVRRRVASIELPVVDGEDAYGFFHRTLRQYRLPATMFDRVQNTVQKQERVGPRAPSGGSGRIVLITVGVMALLMLVLCTGDADRLFSNRRYGPYRGSDIPAAFPLLVDLILSIGAIVIGSALTGRRREASGILLILGGGFGMMMLFIGVLAAMARSTGDFSSGYQFVRHLWQLVVLTLLTVSAYQVVRERKRDEATPWAS